MADYNDNRNRERLQALRQELAINRHSRGDRHVCPGDSTVRCQGCGNFVGEGQFFRSFFYCDECWVSSMPQGIERAWRLFLIERQRHDLGQAGLTPKQAFFSGWTAALTKPYPIPSQGTEPSTTERK